VGNAEAMPTYAVRKLLDLLGAGPSSQELACPNAGNAAVLTISCGQPRFRSEVAKSFGTRAADSDKGSAELIW